MVIVYCEMCGQRVPEEQLQARTAVCYADQRYYCKRCATKLIPSARESQQALPSVSKTPKPGALRAARSGTTPVKKSFDPTWLYIGGGAALLVVSLLVFGRNDARPTSTENVAMLRATESYSPGTVMAVALPAPASQPKPVSAPAPEPADPVKERQRESEREFENLRLQRAAKLLDEIREWRANNPNDPWGYKDRLEQMVGSYRATPAAVEAAKILLTLKIPDGPRPAPIPPPAILPIAWMDEPGDGWQPILDGKSPPFLSGTWGNWRYDDGTLVSSGGVSNQTDFSFADGDVRIRFQLDNSPWVEFSIRQSDVRGYNVSLDRRVLEPVWGRPLELLVVCRGESVKASINGQPVPLEPGGKPRIGRIHISNASGSMRLFSIDYRPVAASKF